MHPFTNVISSMHMQGPTAIFELVRKCTLWPLINKIKFSQTSYKSYPMSDSFQQSNELKQIICARMDNQAIIRTACITKNKMRIIIEDLLGQQ